MKSILDRSDRSRQRKRHTGKIENVPLGEGGHPAVYRRGEKASENGTKHVAAATEMARTDFDSSNSDHAAEPDYFSLMESSLLSPVSRDALAVLAHMRAFCARSCIKRGCPHLHPRSCQMRWLHVDYEDLSCHHPGIMGTHSRMDASTIVLYSAYVLQLRH